jgi:methionine synthase II (cobalamin-independent)
MVIEKHILIEDLVRELPQSVTYLMEQGIRCLRCGEPIWGTLESAAKEKGFSESKIEEFVKELNALYCLRHKT